MLIHLFTYTVVRRFGIVVLEERLCECMASDRDAGDA